MVLNALPGVALSKKLFSAVTSPLKGMFAVDKNAAIEDKKGAHPQRERLGLTVVKEMMKET